MNGEVSPPCRFPHWTGITFEIQFPHFHIHKVWNTNTQEASNIRDKLHLPVYEIKQGGESHQKQLQRPNCINIQ